MHELATFNFDLPFTPVTHPQADWVQTITDRWCTRFNLLRTPCVAAKFRALGYGRLMSTLCPDAPVEGVSLVAQWTSLFFIADDQQNNAFTTGRLGVYEALIEDMRLLINNHAPSVKTDHPLLAALADLLDRTMPGRPDYWVSRVRSNLNLWLDGHLQENHFRVSGTIPTVEQYIAVRREACTVYPTLDIAELIEGATIPDPLYHSSEFKHLVEGTADLMCWINDIHSLHMEQGDPMNMVSVLAHHEGLDMRCAVDAVLMRIKDRLEDYTRAIRDMPQTMNLLGIDERLRPGIMRCVRDYQSWTAGMECWDRQDTIRFAPEQLAASGRLPHYVEDLLL